MSIRRFLAALPFLFLPAFLQAQAEFNRLTFHQAPKPLADDAKTEDWPRFLGPRHDLHCGETKLLKNWPEFGPAKVWEVKRGSGHAMPVISGDRLVLIHLLGGNEVVECLHAETGKRFWKLEYPVNAGSSYGISDAPRAGPVIDGDLVFTVGLAGDLHAVNLETGEIAWKKNLDEEFGETPLFFARGSCPLVLGDQLILNTGGDACVVSLNKKTGEVIWKAAHDWQASYSSPVPAKLHGKDRVLVFAGGMTRPPSGGLLSVNPENGQIDAAVPWRAYNFASVNVAAPVSTGTGVFVTEGYDRGGAYIEFSQDLQQAKIGWSTLSFASQITTPVLHEGHFYGFHGSSESGTELVCYEAKTGREIWREDMIVETSQGRALLGRGGLIRADGAFLCLGAQGTLLWLDLSPSGAKITAKAQLFRAPETWGTPVISRGLLFVNQNQMGSRLICYDLRGK